MGTVFSTALLAALRRRLLLRLRTWRFAHLSLAAVIVVGTAVHATLIEGTMETILKAALCGDRARHGRRPGLAKAGGVALSEPPCDRQRHPADLQRRSCFSLKCR